MNQVAPPLTELGEYILPIIPRYLIRVPLRVLQALFEDLRQTSLAGEPLSESQHSSLRTLFGKKVGESLQYVEHEQVKCYTSRDSDNRVYTVTTYSATKKKYNVYLVFPYHYCECESFAFDVMPKKAIFCKHILATWLANALGKCVEEEVDDDELKRILRQHSPTDVKNGSNDDAVHLF